MDISIIGHPVSSPIRFDIPLKFPDEDLARYPWLRQRERYYSLDRQLDRGGVSIPLLGYPCDAQGIRIPDSPQVVIKFPKIDPENYTSTDLDVRLNKNRIKCIVEWEHVRKRLLNCRNANPIFDLGTCWL